MNNMVTIKANAKINLFLDILGKRNDGYHDIFSIMQSISLADTVSVQKTNKSGIQITSNIENIPLDEKNIAYKVADRFSELTGKELKINIHLEKQIPAEAGLAGGSADGAAVIRALDVLYGTGLSDEQLINIGASVGCDIPFCLFGGTYKAENKGELLTKLADIKPLKIAIVKPTFSVSTAWAYKQFAGMDIVKPDSDGATREILSGNYDYIYNVFESICRTEYPQIDAIKNKCQELGASSVMMSGSGSAFFILSEDDDVLEKIRDYFLSQNNFAVICETVPSGLEFLVEE